MKLTKEDVVMNPENYNEFSLDNTVMLDMPNREIIAGGQLVKLTPKEYSEYVKYSAGHGFEGERSSPKPLKEYLDNFIASDKYKNLPTASRITEIKHVIRLYRAVAKGKIIKDNPAVEGEARRAAQSLSYEYEKLGK